VEPHFDWQFGFILPYINFFIFLGLAIYFFRKPAREMAAKKRDAFAKLMAEARAVKDAAEARLAELQRRHTGLDREIADIKAIAKDGATQESSKIVADAERLADHLRLEARRIADAEVEKARNALRSEIVEAVKDHVQKKIKSELKDDAQLKLVRGKIADLQNLEADRA
jgi:F0F1-type ATP synthase membrane subunit b/b'